MGLKILLAMLGLASAIFGWWVKYDYEKKKKKKEIDDEIDKADSARDLFRLFDKLRDK